MPLSDRVLSGRLGCRKCQAFPKSSTTINDEQPHIQVIPQKCEHSVGSSGLCFGIFCHDIMYHFAHAGQLRTMQSNGQGFVSLRHKMGPKRNNHMASVASRWLHHYHATVIPSCTRRRGRPARMLVVLAFISHYRTGPVCSSSLHRLLYS